MCGEYGHVGDGWVESRYRFKDRPESAFLGIESRGYHYGEPYGRYHRLYIRHYSHEKYEKQMEKYRSHKIKSRPNGQKRCYPPLHVYYYQNGEYCIAFCYNTPGYRMKKKMPKIYRSIRPRLEYVQARSFLFSSLSSLYSSALF